MTDEKFKDKKILDNFFLSEQSRFFVEDNKHHRQRTYLSPVVNDIYEKNNMGIPIHNNESNLSNYMDIAVWDLSI
ncbi:MAG: hypothetical protein ACX932_03855 [Gammaproteobacteria bacterium]